MSRYRSILAHLPKLSWLPPITTGDRAVDHPLLKADARAAELPQAPTNPRNTFFVGYPYGTSLGEPVLDTAQALAEICTPTASPTAPSPSGPSFDSPERPRPAIPLPLSPDLTPVSSQKVSARTSFFTGRGVPCPSQASPSTLRECRKEISSRHRAPTVADDNKQYWRGSVDNLGSYDIAALLNPSESPLSSVPATPVSPTARLPGDSIGTAISAFDFVNTILLPDQVPRHTQRYQDLVGSKRGPSLQSSPTSPNFNRATGSTSNLLDINHSGSAKSARTVLNHGPAGREAVTNGNPSHARPCRVALDGPSEFASRQDGTSAPAVDNPVSSVPQSKEALSAGSASKVSDIMEIDPDDELQFAAATVQPASSGLNVSEYTSENLSVPYTHSTPSQSSSQADGSSSSTSRQPATPTPQSKNMPAFVSTTQTEPTAEAPLRGTTEPLSMTAETSVASLPSSAGMETLFSNPPAVTKDHALIDDILSRPRKKKTKTMQSARQSPSGSLSSSGTSTPVETSSGTSDSRSTSRQSTPSRITIARFSRPSPPSGSSAKQSAPHIPRNKTARPSWKSQVDPERVAIDTSRPKVASGNAHVGSIIPRSRLTVTPPVEAELAMGSLRPATDTSNTASSSVNNGKSLALHSNTSLSAASIPLERAASTTGTVAKFLLRKPPSFGSIIPARTTNFAKPTSDGSTASNEKEIDPLGSQEVDESVPADVLRAVQLTGRRVLFKNVPSLDQHRAGEKRKRSVL